MTPRPHDSFVCTPVRLFEIHWLGLHPIPPPHPQAIYWLLSTLLDLKKTGSVRGKWQEEPPGVLLQRIRRTQVSTHHNPTHVLLPTVPITHPDWHTLHLWPSSWEVFINKGTCLWEPDLHRSSPGDNRWHIWGVAMPELSQQLYLHFYRL